MTLPGIRRVSDYGFTLPELLIVSAVLAILAGIVVTQSRASQQRARDTIRRSDLKQYQTSLEIYFNSHTAYPVGNTNLPALCGTLGLTTACPGDPHGGVYHYNSPTGTNYTLYATLEYIPSGTTQQNFIVHSDGRTCTINLPATTCP